MNILLFLGIALVIILIVYDIFAEDYKNSEIKYIEYVYQAHKMLSKAIREYNLDCIRNCTKPLVDTKDLMSLNVAWNVFPGPFAYTDLIEKEKLEVLKPYLPENPVQYILEKTEEEMNRRWN